MDKIFTATDRAQELGHDNYFSLLESIMKREIPREIEGEPVYARVDFGRWLADCECGGASYVDPEKDGFFCGACKNNGGKLRPVIFPENYKEIETELLLRVVYLPTGKKGTQASINAKGLSRSWTRPETVKDLQEQRMKHGV